MSPSASLHTNQPAPSVHLAALTGRASHDATTAPVNTESAPVTDPRLSDHLAQRTDVKSPTDSSVRETLWFLRSVLPASGLYVAARLVNGKFRNQICDSLEELAQRVLMYDAQGVAAYMAMGTYRERFVDVPQADGTTKRKVRTQENVEALRALWLDLDVEPGNEKKHESQEAALEALTKFCADTGLPPAMRISSGLGVHVYFCLTADTAPSLWLPVAVNLKFLSEKCGLKADPSCTTDSARVLRPVGTTNRKQAGAPQSVRVIEDAEPIAFERFASLVDAACARYEVRVPDARPRERSKVIRGGINADFMVPENYLPSSANKIADQCAQMRAFRAGAHQSEPVWHASLALLRHTVESDAIAHEWSSLDPRYRQDQTAEKLTRLGDDDIGPTTCARFAFLNPTGCAECPHRGQITSPISLGHERGDSDNYTRSASNCAPIATAPPVAAFEPISSTHVAALMQGAASPTGVRATVEPQAPMPTGAQPSGTIITFPTMPRTERLFDLSDASVRDLLSRTPPRRRYLLKNCLPVGKVGAIIAPGGTGKSQFVLQMAISIASGLPLAGGGWEVEETGGVLALFAEDDSEEVHRRLHFTVKSMRSSPSAGSLAETLEGRLFIRSMVAEENLMTASHPLDKRIYRTLYADKLIRTAQDIPDLKLIIVDPASRFRGGDENNAEDMTRFVEALEYVSKQTGAGVLVIHHANKGSMRGEEQTQSAARGSSAFSDGVRWQMNLAGLNTKEAARVPADERHMYLSATVTKNNYAQPQPTVYLKRAEGGVLTKVALEDAAGKKGGNILLRIVARVRDGEPMSAATFEKQFGGKDNVFGIGETALRGFIKQAIDAGHLTNATVGRERPLVITDSGRAVLSVMDAVGA